MDKNDSKKRISNIGYLMNNNRLDSALYQIEEYIELYGKNEYISLEIAKIHKYKKEFNKAKELLNEILSKKCENFGYVAYELAKICEIEQDYNTAVEYYLLIINSNHKDKIPATYSLGLCYFMMNKYNESRTYLEDVVNNDISGRYKENAKYHLARIYNRLNNDKKAKEILSKIIINGDNELQCSVLLLKSKIEAKKGNMEKHKELIYKILNNYDSKNIPALFEKLGILVKERKIEEADKIYLNIKDKINDKEKYMIIVGSYYEAKNKIKEAEKLYKNIKRKEGNNLYYAKLRLANLEIKKGNFQESRRYINEVMNLDDNFKETAQLRLVQLDLYEGNLKEALKTFKEINTKKVRKDKQEDYIYIKMLIEKICNFPSVYPDNLRYGLKQLLNYDIIETVNHIKKRHINNLNNTINFPNNIDISKLYNDVKPYLCKENIIEIGTSVNYLISSPEYIKNENSEIEYITVVCELYTNNILTIYPSSISGEPIIEEYKPKVKEIKKISRIEQFNKKYGIK